jgi:hypothetical protein
VSERFEVKPESVDTGRQDKLKFSGGSTPDIASDRKSGDHSTASDITSDRKSGIVAQDNILTRLQIVVY